MIKVEHLSYSFPEKDLYRDISFTLEDGQHCAFIGSNGTGKSTLADMLINTDKYLYDGKIIRTDSGRCGYVSQFEKEDKEQDVTVFDYLAEEFVKNVQRTEEICKAMETAEQLDELLEEYQRLLDEFQSMDGDNYESNIKKQLKLAGLAHAEQLKLSELSGGEYKLVQVIRQMLLRPELLIMDEPDVFLDFSNIAGLCDLINSHKGTLLVITHSRYLLNHCFDKILHLENAEIREFDGTYVDYNFHLLQKKIELQELAAADMEEIERNRELVERLRNEATYVYSVSKGKTLHARESFLERLEARRVREPFVEVRQPDISFPEVEVKEQNGEEEPEVLLKVEDYGLSFDELLLEHVNFEVRAGEKVAIVGPNGTGKTTLFREIFKRQNPAITVSEDTEIGFLSQIYGDMLNEEHTIYEEFFDMGFETKAQIGEYLERYCIDTDSLNKQIGFLSGGEKNLLQLAKIALRNANLLLLDEPTSHLDTYAQLALEKAVQNYRGAVLMVSHDFYHIVNCADYVLYVENKSVRRVRVRSFRKMVYEKHFEKDYLELEQKKKELETKIEFCLSEGEFETAKKTCQQLEKIIKQMS